MHIQNEAAIYLFFFTPYSYTAVAMPMLYNTRYSSRRRVTVMISVVWVLSFAISCPLLFGLNNTGENEYDRHLFYSRSNCISHSLHSKMHFVVRDAHNWYAGAHTWQKSHVQRVFHWLTHVCSGAQKQWCTLLIFGAHAHLHASYEQSCLLCITTE